MAPLRAARRSVGCGNNGSLLPQPLPMARYLSYHSLTERGLPSREDVQWLAGRIAQLPAFTTGDAVLCGSVCWGSHHWRSDIDIAHFSTLACPRLEAQVRPVVEAFRARLGEHMVAPKVDIVVVGAEELVAAAPTAGLSGVSPSAAAVAAAAAPAARLFDDVAMRFADHIGALAALRAEPWRGFLQRHLSGVQSTRERRLDDIRSYVSGVTEAWAGQPMHPLERAPDGNLQRHQLDLLSHAENYPVNLMRRMLAELGRYPQPDRVEDIRGVFAALDDRWARSMQAALPPFDALARGYDALAARARQAGTDLGAEEFNSTLTALAAALPFAAVQEAVWDYLKSRC